MLAIFPENLVKQEMCPDRWVRGSRGSPGHLRAVAAHAAAARGAVRKGAQDAGAHLLQIRRRQSRRQPQAQHRRGAGVLQQGRRHQTARHRNRRGPVGFVAGAGVQIVRPGVQCLYGQGELPVEAVSPDAHAHLGRDGASESERPDRIRPQAARGRPELSRQPRHRHQRGHRGHRHASEHEIFPRQRAEPRLPAPDGHRPGSHETDGTRGRGAGYHHRLLRRRQQFRRAGVSVHSARKSRTRKNTGLSPSSRRPARR